MNALLPLTLAAGLALGAKYLPDCPFDGPCAATDAALAGGDPSECGGGAALGIAGFAEEGEEKKDETPKPYDIGATIDEALVLRDIDGKSHAFKDLRGKVVFLFFDSVTCPYIPPAMPKVRALVEEYKEKPVVVLSINANQREIGAEPKQTAVDEPQEPYAALKAHAKKYEATYPLCVDHGNKVSERFQARTTPHCFVISAKGVLAYAGALDDDPRGAKKESGETVTNYVKKAIDALLTDGTVDPTSTKPYGCSIKK